MAETDTKFVELGDQLSEIRHQLMTAEITDVGWDLRDQMLAMLEVMRTLKNLTAAIARDTNNSATCTVASPAPSAPEAEQHSALPWRQGFAEWRAREVGYITNGDGNDDHSIICRGGLWDGVRCGFLRAADADFAVRACNAHYVLLSALKSARHLCEEHVEPSAPPTFHNMVVQIIDAAIAKATGGTK